MSNITPEYIIEQAGGIELASESAHQQALFLWASQNAEKYPALELMFHIPNGGSRNIREASRFKLEGVKPGVPDIFLPVGRRGDYVNFVNLGMFIEMKRVSGRISIEQMIYIDELRKQAYYVVVCYSYKEAIEEIVKYLS